MKSLYLAWQAPENSPQSKAWYPIGRLDAESEGNDVVSCRFRYTGGALKAREDVGFEPLMSFPEFEKDYTSKKLFPLFQNRVISPKRADYPEYISWLGLRPDEADPISILSVSGGARVTDRLHTIPRVDQKPDGSFKLRFFVHGLRHLPEYSQQRAKNLKPGDQLSVMVEVNNPATRLAVCLLTGGDEYTMVGWAPRYLVGDLIKCIPEAPEIKATVVKVNEAHAPINQSLLVEYSGRAPKNHHLMSSPDFSPLVGD